MSTLAQTLTVVGATAGLLTLQAFWIARAFDALRDDNREHRAETRAGFTHVNERLDALILGVIHEHGERLARLESERP